MITQTGLGTTKLYTLKGFMLCEFTKNSKKKKKKLCQHSGKALCVSQGTPNLSLNTCVRRNSNINGNNMERSTCPYKFGNENLRDA